MQSKLWMIPFAYTFYVISLNVLNAWYIVEDKPVASLGYIATWWFCIFIFSLWIVLEVGLSKLEEM